jgi:catechol 2,3-dioxygenase-like lactoylglutathione lyase family enzyme
VNLRRTHHVALTTPNLARLYSFYVDLLGLPPAGGFPEHNIKFVDVGTTLLELIDEPAATGERRQGGWSHLALEVDDVDVSYLALVRRGVDFDVAPEDFPRMPRDSESRSSETPMEIRSSSCSQFRRR